MAAVAKVREANEANEAEELNFTVTSNANYNTYNGREVSKVVYFC